MNGDDDRMLPLQDVRIVALEQYGAGPFGSMHLADLGADVIKIEDPSTGGDVGRYVPPYANGENSLFFESFNRNKRSLSLDMSNDAGRAVFEELVRHSDAVYSNLRGDVPEKLKIRFDDVKHLNERIVCCSLTGFGMTGPRQRHGGYDYVLQGLAGWMTLTGEPGGPPAKTGPSLVDYSGGLVAAIALMSGVHAARRDGRGMDCDLSLFDTALAMLTYLGTWHLSAGYEPGRTTQSAHPSLVPFQAFEAADGWIIVACAKEKFWRRLTVVLERPDLAEDPRYATFATREVNKETLLDELTVLFAKRTVNQWTSVLQEAGVPCGPVNSVDEALRDEHTLARDMIATTEHPVLGTVRQVASPLKVGDNKPAMRRAPLRNEHAEEILTDLLGYSDNQIADLARRGAFGTEPGHPMDGRAGLG